MILQDEPLKNNRQTIQKIESHFDDERLDLPSASKIESYFLCPGKYLAENGIPDESSGEDADRGTRIHDFLSNPLKIYEDALDSEEKEVAYMCAEQARQVIREWNSDHVPYSIEYEKRIWLKNAELDKILSGKADALMIAGDRALIIDYKTGRNGSVESARNEQLRTLALLLFFDNISIKNIRVAIIQPLVSKTPEVCDYSGDDINESYIRLMGLLTNIEYPRSIRRAGERQCKYCKAKMTCPEANQALIIPKLSNEVSAIQISDLLDRAAVADIMVNAIRAKAKEMAISGVQIPNYQLKEGNEIRIIKNAQKAYECLKVNLTADEFRECCHVRVIDISDRLSEKLDLHGRNLRNKVAELLGDHMEIKKNAPSLKHI